MTALALAPVALAAGACKAQTAGADLQALPVATTTTSSTTTSTTAAAPPPSTAAPTTTTTTAPPPPPAPRSVLDTGFQPFLKAGDVTLNYPTPRVERVGFHESTLAGARVLEVLPGAGETLDMPSRDRKTSARTAADILSDPDREVRVPVTGTVKRGGTYTLYCKYTDSFAVIQPDAHPGWEVKVLHISGLAVTVGQRVEAGVTPLAAHPTRLPFHSQVEDYSTAPAWPHVHVEVDDPSIKNPPGVGGGGCN
ncbi:MAG: hypothetical protein QOJ00_707 [Actinomycetota bacterium]